MTNTKVIRVGRVLALLGLSLLLAGCGSSSKPAVPAGAVQTYTMRGVVTQLPEPGRPGSELMIHHKSVPGFVDDSGRVVGMESMTMGFTPAKDVSLEGLKPGDKIEFVLSVDWPDNRIHITKITVLPADTELNLGE